MADRLDVVAVGIEDEGGVVALVVVRPLAGRAVVASAGGERRVVEGLDGVAVRGGEGDVELALQRFAGADPEARLLRTEPGEGGAAGGFGRDLEEDPDAERRQGGGIA